MPLTFNKDLFIHLKYLITAQVMFSNKPLFFGRLIITNLGKKVESPNLAQVKKLLIITDGMKSRKLTQRLCFWGNFSKIG